MVDVPGGSARWIRRYRYLQRIAISGITSFRVWLGTESRCSWDTGVVPQGETNS